MKNIHQKLFGMQFKYIKLCIVFLIPLIGVGQDLSTDLEEGKQKYNQKEFKAAIKIFETLLENYPENADIHFWLGSSNIEALQEASLFEKASLSYYGLKHLKQAIAIDSSHIQARVRLANYYLHAPAIAGGSYSKALEQAIALRDYDKTTAYSLEASIYTSQKEYDKAVQLYLDLIEQKENNYKVYYRLAVISSEQQDYKKAIEYCQKSIDIYPDYLMGHYQYGKVAALGRIYVEKGIRNLQHYINSELESNLPGKHWAYLRLGDLYESKGEMSKAKEAYQKAIKLKPEFDKARDAVKKLNRN